MGKTFDRIVTSLYLFIPVALVAKFLHLASWCSL